MTGYKVAWLILMVLLPESFLFGQSKKNFPLVLHFQNQIGEKLLSLDSTYTNPYGELFTVRNFRYYISRLSVTGTNGKKLKLPVNYYLIDERKPDSKSIKLQVPFPAVKTIEFEIGVDSAKNESNVQTGSLDPANGMFWTWSSGFIFAKLEGNSPQAKAPQNAFTYHIGGFRKGENAIRHIRLELSEAMTTLRRPDFFIIANINTWFDSIYSFKIAELASIMTPGRQAMQMADNYSKMFRISVPD